MNKKSKIIILIAVLIIIMSISFLVYHKVKYSNINRNAKISDITFNKKVNVYFFWGDGCPHCKEEFEFLESINNKYKKYYNLYGFEVWEHKDNEKLLENIAEILKKVADGIPFMIIGEHVIVGFKEENKEEIKKYIKEEYEKENRYDVFQEYLREDDKNEK